MKKKLNDEILRKMKGNKQQLYNKRETKKKN